MGTEEGRKGENEEGDDLNGWFPPIEGRRTGRSMAGVSTFLPFRDLERVTKAPSCSTSSVTSPEPLASCTGNCREPYEEGLFDDVAELFRCIGKEPATAPELLCRPMGTVAEGLKKSSSKNLELNSASISSTPNSAWVLYLHSKNSEPRGVWTGAKVND